MRAFALVLLFVAFVSSGCAPPVDLTKGIQVQDVATGWFDAGIVDGQNKLVPTISFRLKDVSDQKLLMLQVSVVFRRVNENDEWGSGFVTAAGSQGLAPGATTAMLTVKSQLGYTGANQSREEMLHNGQFVDAKAELSAKYGAELLKRIGDFPITRQLLVK